MCQHKEKCIYSAADMTDEQEPEKNWHFHTAPPSYLEELTKERIIRKKFELREGHFLSTEEVAKILSVKEEVVRDLIRKRELPAVKIGKAYRITEIDLQLFLNDRYTPHMTGKSSAEHDSA